MTDVDANTRISWHPNHRVYPEARRRWKLWTGSPRWRQCLRVASVATDRKPLLKSGVLSWGKLLADSIPKGEASKKSLEDFLVQLKMQYFSEQDLVEINNGFQNLKMGRMSVIE